MKNIYAEIITIGDELLFGQITDTNSQWISAELDKIGIRTIRKSSVGDIEEEILNILSEAEKRADIILITGGLGPTKDDITKKTLAKFFNCAISLHEAALKDLTYLFERRGKEVTETNKYQAYLPEACHYIHNKIGTAPGMWFEKNNSVFMSMAGVPFEMKEMMTNQVLPKLKTHFLAPSIVHQYIQTIGIGESNLADLISDWEAQLPKNIRLAYLPSLGGVKLRLTSTGEAVVSLQKEIDIEVNKIKKIIGEYIFGYSEEPLEKIIGDSLKEKKLTLAAAESCTGGFFSHLLTSIPGSSEFFKGSVIAYHNEVKSSLLNVPEEELAEFGAVSENTVIKMANAVRVRLGTHIGVAASGIAGPGGGTVEKPVGTIWIAYSDSKKTITKKLILGTKRDLNIRLASYSLLDMIRKAI